MRAKAANLQSMEQLHVESTRYDVNSYVGGPATIRDLCFVKKEENGPLSLCPPDLKARNAPPTSSAIPSKSCASRRARKDGRNTYIDYATLV